MSKIRRCKKYSFILVMYVSILSLMLINTGLKPGLADTGTRPGKWAQPLKIPGVPNLYRVSKSLYRGAQPNRRGMSKLEKMGIKTVVNLRSFNSDRDELIGTGLFYVHITMKAWHPEDKEIARFLKIVTDTKLTPVFVHCQHGADRTGTMCALYRIVVCGWTKEEAIREMREGGFGYHRVWDKTLVRYIRRLEIKRIRALLNSE